MIQVEALLEEVKADPPCGPDLEYDAQFLELDQLSRSKPEQQFGETIIPAEEPDWAQVAERAQALLNRSKDLRVATILTRALVHTEQFQGLQPGIELIRGLLERHWDHVHPKLDADDSDPTMRLNALAVLADGDGLLRDLRGAALVRSRGHQLLVREVEVARGNLQPRAGETAVPASELNGLVAGAASNGDFAPNCVAEAMTTLKSLSTLLNERVGSDRAPDLLPLATSLKVLDDAVKTALPELRAEAAGEAAAEGRAPGRLAIGAGEVVSRQDALLLIDKVISYFERQEPSSPAPLLLKRAKRLIAMNFVDIIKDLVPDGMDRIHTIAGTTEEQQ